VQIVVIVTSSVFGAAWYRLAYIFSLFFNDEFKIVETILKFVTDNNERYSYDCESDGVNDNDDGNIDDNGEMLLTIHPRM
jgi:hypothetical protein